MTLVNEAGGVLGRLTVHAGDRYMYLGWPEWRRHLQTLRPEDLTDANGDGKKTLRMFTKAEIKRQNPDGTVTEQQPGEHMLDLEITRLSDDELMVWFKPHPLDYLDAVGQPHPGWPYYRQTLRTEDGGKSLTSGYPGETYELSIEERPLTGADFPDSDGNGRAMTRFYDFGPGDTVSLPATVYVKRRADGGYELKANVQTDVTW
jgi:hypothetical protein